MYCYHAQRQKDALQHALDQAGDPIGLGDSVLVWQDVYGYVTERRAGVLVARHAPILDPATGRVEGWRTLERPADDTPQTPGETT